MVLKTPLGRKHGAGGDRGRKDVGDKEEKKISLVTLKRKLKSIEVKGIS